MSEPESMWSETRDMDSIGGRIRRAREAANFSGAQLARRLGIKTATVTAWETGRSEPRANRLTMLAGFLAVSPTWLLYGVGGAPADEPMTTELSLIAASLKNLRDTHERTGEALDRLEEQIGRLAQAARSQADEAAGHS
ncbi:helix-turn-helix domain-containing protein [Stappia stellulata]|uniref:helix-turn-helix domain-containing protein n=1 Tax=Stappia stellulata TaxID=71235 RepID=UPI0003F7EF2E|nr:helix-turn-helix domain-containing protein [Stappia stellulata]